MRNSTQKTARKVQARIARHKNVRYHNDSYLFPDNNIKNCPVCKRDFMNRKKWESRGLWPFIIYCSKACRKKSSTVPVI
jgi:hypothetical protein